MSKKRFSMANPYREMSKVSPQLEDGFLQFNNEVFEHLLLWPLTARELKICLLVIRKTWGFNKTYDIISVSQFVEETDTKDRAVKYCLKRLRDMRLLVSKKSRRVQNGTPVNCYLFNKYWDTWIERPQKRVQNCARVQKAVKNGCSKLHPQNTYTKDRGNFSNGKKPEIELDPLIVAMQKKTERERNQKAEESK